MKSVGGNFHSSMFSGLQLSHELCFFNSTTHSVNPVGHKISRVKKQIQLEENLLDTAPMKERGMSDQNGLHFSNLCHTVLNQLTALFRFHLLLFLL